MHASMYTCVYVQYSSVISQAYYYRCFTNVADCDLNMNNVIKSMPFIHQLTIKINCYNFTNHVDH